MLPPSTLLSTLPSTCQSVAPMLCTLPPGGKPSVAQRGKAVAVPSKQPGRVLGGASGDTKGDGQTTALPACQPHGVAAEMDPNAGSNGGQQGMVLPVVAAGAPGRAAAPAIQLQRQYTDHADAQALLPAPVPAWTPGASSGEKGVARHGLTGSCQLAGTAGL